MAFDSLPLQGFSHDLPYPNILYGYYPDSGHVWNELGDGSIFQSYSFPIILLNDKDQSQKILSQALFNSESGFKGALYSAQIYYQMNANYSTAQGSASCLEEGLISPSKLFIYLFFLGDGSYFPLCRIISYGGDGMINKNPGQCQPVGGQSVWSDLFPSLLQTNSEASIIISSSALDSNAFFHDNGLLPLPFHLQAKYKQVKVKPPPSLPPSLSPSQPQKQQ